MAEIIERDEGINRIFRQSCIKAYEEIANKKGISVESNSIQQWVNYLSIRDILPSIFSPSREGHVIFREIFNKMLLNEGYPSIEDIILLSYQEDEKKKKTKGERGLRITKSIRTYSKELIAGIESWDEKEKQERIEEKTTEEIFPLTKPSIETISFNPITLELGKMEKENTFDSFKIWDEYWSSDRSEEYELLKPRLATYAVLKDEELGGKILDFGCGAFSPLLEALEDKGIEAQVIAADCKSAIEKSKKRFKSKNITHVILPKPAPYYWGFERELFDYIVFSNVLHNINRISKAPVLLLSDSSLKENGNMLIIEPREKEEDVEETREYLESMGYDLKIKRRKVKWKNSNPSYLFVLLANKKEEMDEKRRSELLNKWMALASAKDLMLKEVMTYSSLSQIPIKEIVGKIKKLESINVFSPIPKPDYSEIRKKVEEAVMQKVELEIRTALEKIKSFLYDKSLQWQYGIQIEDKYREALFDLVLKLWKKELEPNDFKEVVEKYGLRAGGKERKKGLTAEHILRNYFNELNKTFLNKLLVYVEEGEVKFSDMRWTLKRIEEEINVLSEKEYARALQEIEKQYRLSIYI